jgi:sugar phosphate permease
MVAYIVAVLQRSSFGVAGLDAAARFDAGASLVASFAMLQLVVYAALQIPVGVMLDRLGPRVLIATGSAVMAAGRCRRPSPAAPWSARGTR